ncbi:hypothetical protein Pmani_002891 [Petrolisthes manimaculis]|uniref:Uncharacterized protein n=1 Tax=Petrolisthes manimaculis TaxID=1843537 RepID=A0AAE1QK05_9EUCA|nr:hypothetical protein Pmani_002891 [Petrolisthes manimaculis]
MPHRHSLIARPKGLPGYAPGVWCAVCGKTAASTGTASCVTPGCPNVCHHHCLSDTTQQNFTCEDVGALRNLLGIQDVVTYVPDTLDPIHSPPPSISDINLNDITVTSTATSSRGNTIDKDWTQHTAQHTESRDWWTSGKPRQLQRSSTDIITISTQTDSPTTPSVPILPAPVITEETQQIPPAPELSLPGDSTSPAGPALSPRTSPPTPKSRNTTATISDNRSANPTPAYRKKKPVPLHQLGEVQVTTELAETTHTILPPKTQERLAEAITRPLYTNRASHKEVVTTIDLTRQIQIHAHTLSHFCPCPPRGGPPPGSTITTARGLDIRTTTATGKTGVITAAAKVILLIAVDLSLLKKDTRSSVTN